MKDNVGNKSERKNSKGGEKKTQEPDHGDGRYFTETVSFLSEGGRPGETERWGGGPFLKRTAENVEMRRVFPLQRVGEASKESATGIQSFHRSTRGDLFYEKRLL